MRWSRRQRRVVERQRIVDRGATAVEYALVVGLIAGLVIGSVSTIGVALAGFFGSVSPWV